MNAKKLNFTRLNTSVLNASVLNSSLMGGRGKGSSSRPSGLIAQYKPYLNSNDSPTRDVLKDYSGHGNDVVLHNFAFTEESGYNTTTYPGALVSDGVDDYGISEKSLGNIGAFIALLKEVNWPNISFLLNVGTGTEEGRLFCRKSETGNIESSIPVRSTPINNGFITYSRTPSSNNNSMSLFGLNKSYLCSVALYSLEIYDRDLTEEEIETVKQRMIAEYEKAT